MFIVILPRTHCDRSAVWKVELVHALRSGKSQRECRVVWDNGPLASARRVVGESALVNAFGGGRCLAFIDAQLGAGTRCRAATTDDTEKDRRSSEVWRLHVTCTCPVDDEIRCRTHERMDLSLRRRGRGSRSFDAFKPVRRWHPVDGQRRVLFEALPIGAWQ